LTIAPLLQNAGVDARVASQILLFILQRPLDDRAWLITHGDRFLTPIQVAKFHRLCKEYKNGVPLAYLYQEQAFWNLSLYVDTNVLIPRPDTETLVAWGFELPLPQNAQVLDLGTGSGAIALTFKQERPHWQCTATDLSARALQIAKDNAKRLGLRIRLLQGHWFQALSTEEKHLYYLIVSNPPYIAIADRHLKDLQHEPHLALVSGSDGLDAIRHIVSHAPQFLASGGWLLLEHGFDQGAAVAELLIQRGFQNITQRKDLGGRIRCTGGFFTLAGAKPTLFP
jgi:release factor glutamine methyltransferase